MELVTSHLLAMILLKYISQPKLTCNKYRWEDQTGQDMSEYYCQQVCQSDNFGMVNHLLNY